MKYFAIVLLISFISCKGSKESSANLSAEASTTTQVTQKQVTTYTELATEKLGEGVKFFKNKSETLVLCKKVTFSKNIPMGRPGASTPVSSSGAGNVQLMVINIASGKVLYEQSIAYGSADWASDTQLRIVHVMGANMPNNPNMYLYDVLSKEKTPIDNGNIKKIEKN